MRHFNIDIWTDKGMSARIRLTWPNNNQRIKTEKLFLDDGTPRKYSASQNKDFDALAVTQMVTRKDG